MPNFLHYRYGELSIIYNNKKNCMVAECSDLSLNTTNTKAYHSVQY